MTWFESLTGFKEVSPDQVRSMLILSDQTISSRKNNQTYICGHLETPSLSDLRNRTSLEHLSDGILEVEELVGDVQHFHKNPSNTSAFFQAASQFNLLEMVAPEVSPEEGIGIYEHDHTQGPACAIAAGAGTIYRNYFAKVNGQIGQTANNQIDCLHDMGVALGNHNEQLWEMQNGYALPNEHGLAAIDKKIAAMDEHQRDELRQKLRIGLQWNTQVTLDHCQHKVTQAYCSALPVAYSKLPNDLWRNFATLILEASYEATLHAALLNYRNTQNSTVFLTLLGGGVFGNREEWIFSSIRRALHIFKQTPLKIKMLSYGQSNPQLRAFLASLK